MKKKIKKVLVVGAGYMGSAITFPISDNEIEVALWGTWLDDQIIEQCQKGNEHPRLGIKLNPAVTTYYSGDIDDAIEGADVIIMAVSSEGFVPVYEKLIKFLDFDSDINIIILTKGFVSYNDSIMRIDQYLENVNSEELSAKSRFSFGFVGGPVKAVELAKKIPSVTIVGSENKVIHNIFSTFETKYYRVSHTYDLVGLEICSALKNVYAIAGGICDGFYGDSMPNQYHNLKSALFMQAINEMATVSKAFGGKYETAHGLAGAGDLYVTIASGRNSLFGRRIGKGENPDIAYKEMLEDNKLAEGYNNLYLAEIMFRKSNFDYASKLPLFNTLFKIVFIDKKYSDQLESLVSTLDI